MSNKRTTHKPSNCNKEECIKEWQNLGGKTQEEEDLEYKECYGLQHCMKKDCHAIYFRGKNGETCEGCRKHYCELCSSYSGKFTSGEVYFCKQCVDNGHYETDDDDDDNDDEYNDEDD